MRTEKFQEREKVFSEGDTGDKFYIILSGRCTVYKSIKTEIGTEILVKLPANNFFTFVETPR